MLSVQLLHPTQVRFKLSHPGMDDKLQEGEGMFTPWIDWHMAIYSFSNKMKISTKIGGDLIFYLEISKQRVINGIPNKEHNLSHIEPVVWNPREKVHETLELENNL